MIKIGIATSSWSGFEPGKLGDPAGYVQVFDGIQQSGYEGTDMGDLGFMPTDAHLLKDELQKRSLEMISALIPVNFKNKTDHASGELAALRTAKLLSDVGGSDPFIILSDDIGHDPLRFKNAGRIRPEMGLLPFQWKDFACGVERIAEKVKSETGLRTVFHHHCGGFVETPGEVGMLLDYTNPELVGLCFDTGHYRFAGGDPLRLFRVFADRIWLIHFKECDPVIARQSGQEGWNYLESVRQGVFCELGKGDVDFQAVKNELNKINYSGWIVVEQNIQPGHGQPIESALRNRNYLRGIGL